MLLSSGLRSVGVLRAIFGFEGKNTLAALNSGSVVNFRAEEVELERTIRKRQ